MKDDAIYVRHILECIRRVEENTAGGFDAFMASHTLQDAVLRNLQTMAESTQRLSPAARAAAPSVDWTALSGSRNVLVHDCLGIDLQRIWTIVEQDVPVLEAALQAHPAASLPRQDQDANHSL